MPYFGKVSQKRLSLAHPDMQKLFIEVVKDFDCTVICSHRSEEDQETAFRLGMSKVHYPNSKHNQNPSRAVDVAPWPLDWKELNRFYYFGGFVKSVARRLDLRVRWGGDWDGDFHIKDQNFHDLPHFELI